MKKVLFPILALILAMGLVVAAPASASIIQEDVFTYFFPNEGDDLGNPATWTGEVQVVERMLDEEQTTAFYEGMSWAVPVTGQEAFIYEVTNVNWTPINGVNGLSGFNIYNQFDIDTVGNAFGPPGWEAFAGYSGVNTLPNPDNFEWDIRADLGTGLLVGQTGLFGFTVAAGKYIDVHYGPGHWMHSWLGAVQVDTCDMDEISGPAPFVTKELTEGPTVVELGVETEFVLRITVTNNDDDDPITDVVVKDRLGGDLKLDGWGASVGTVSTYTKGKTEKVFLTWDVGTTLAPGESATLTLTVSTDINPGTGNGKKDGHQEYTETGTHCLNSGANAKGILRGVQVSATSDPICVEVPEAMLTLENKDSSWNIIVDDTWGVLGYNLAGSTFDYAFNVYGLESDTDYSLIYYADFEDRMNVWGGNNPGALIATMTTDGDGNVCISGSIDLGMDLPSPPDANISIHDYSGTPDFYTNAHGAKIWLVPSDCYNAGLKKVTAWQPTRFLFETDLIWYDDTDA